MNDPAQAGCAAYETDPLFGAFPSGYDVRHQQYGSEPEQHYGSEPYGSDLYGSEREQHHYASGAYPAPGPQYAPAYAYAEPSGQWGGPAAGPYAPPPAAAPGGPGQDLGYGQAHGHAYAYAYEVAAGTQAQDPYGYGQPQPAPGYESTVQWTVPAEALLTPRDPEPAADQETEAAPETETDQANDLEETGPNAGGGPGFDAAQDPAPGPSSGPRAGSRTAARAAGSRSRRRAPAKRSALFTIAVPSACVMGVAGIAAASMGALGGGDDTQDDTATTAASDPSSVKPVAANDTMDTRLAALSADARDFGDRASRTQERIDLKERQAAEKKKRDEAAARKEAARPKYLLPVKQRGLSAYFGQAGVNWMSVHTGIDFPVMTGTPVMAATDGTVRTQWNSSYGNMAIVKAPNGTETWYCHLSSTRVRSGSVKAGDVIAYSGNTGNTTGPHLHFEVRPNGGAAIDPLPWLRGHGLDPT
ncbi:M23 family metallopeptidase [Streptomyces sp. 8L]|uniref:M23 family metallopeptidase n=1 Tax=Streptomyces sp. 8L TaxID=2877242 RepID=UPI001CD74122|nr:M23 family metallopeptidase [Streptomyces sp. 8L]MCA1222651.1 M23 family metallopeptidase [Streptomyces sp. 8L]